MDYQEYEQVRSLALGRGIVVTIDGPSGAGKSTVSRGAAAALDFGYLDTGSMYRACAWWCQYNEVDLGDPQAISAMVATIDLQVNPVAHAPRVVVNGFDVTAAIRENQISQVVSMVSTVGSVREQMIALQRHIIAEAHASGRGIVVEGRDIGTVVAPDAPVRILLTASEDIRVARRARNDQGSDSAQALEAERDIVLGRDEMDSTVASFIEPATGVERIDTSDMSQHAALDAVIYTIGRNIR